MWSTAPAINAAGTIASASTTNSAAPTRQSQRSSMNCRTGAITRVPTEENAPTIPRSRLRRAGEAARAVAVMASEDPVQATQIPVRMPDSVNAGTPLGDAMTSIAAT